MVKDLDLKATPIAPTALVLRYPASVNELFHFSFCADSAFFTFYKKKVKNGVMGQSLQKMYIFDHSHSKFRNILVCESALEM